jgi:hypothetical protein
MIPSPRRTSVRAKKIGRNAWTVAGPSRGTSGSMAASTSSIGTPAIAVIVAPTSASFGGAAAVITSPSVNSYTRRGRAGPSWPGCGSANWWPSRPSRLRSAVTRISPTTDSSAVSPGSSST